MLRKVEVAVLFPVVFVWFVTAGAMVGLMHGCVCAAGDVGFAARQAWGIAMFRLKGDDDE